MRSRVVAGKLTPKLKTSILPKDSPIISQEPFDPPLTEQNAGGRFVYVPPSVFPTIDGQGGWIAKIRSVNKSNKITELQFHDGRQHFKFDQVLEHFKPLM